MRTDWGCDRPLGGGRLEVLKMGTCLSRCRLHDRASHRWRHRKRMKLRYAGVCRLCGVEIPARGDAIYERSTKTVRCVVCPQSSAGASPIRPTPDHRSWSPRPNRARPDRPLAASTSVGRAKDEERLRQKWGKLGGVAVALSSEKQSTKAWERGAVGEELLGARLDSIRSDDIAVLHDRRIPGSRANIDHIVITRAGVWVIDAKRYKGRPELKVEGGILRPRIEKLFVGRRD